MLKTLLARLVIRLSWGLTSRPLTGGPSYLLEDNIIKLCMGV